MAILKSNPVAKHPNRIEPKNRATIRAAKLQNGRRLFFSRGGGQKSQSQTQSQQFVSNKLPYASHWLIRPEMFD